jgi:hypothetical protein
MPSNKFKYCSVIYKMKLVQEAFDIYDVSSPAYRLFKFIGLAPLSYQELMTLGKFKTTRLDQVYIFFLLAFHIFMNILLFEIRGYFENFGLTEILSIGWQACLHFSIFSKVVCIVHSYQKRNDLIKFLKSIEMCDKRVRCFAS